MWLTFAIVLCASWPGKAVSTQLGLLARSRVQGLAATAAVDGRADFELGIGASLTSSPSCDSDLSGPICFSQAGRQQALMPNAVPSGLVGHWTFDSDVAIDSSGNGNHAVTELVHGPSPVGSGHSAVFTRNFMMIPNSELLKLTDFTYSFWVYLLDDGTNGAEDRSATWCPLIRKGIHMESTEQFASAPALLFNHRTGHLRAEVTTGVNNLEGQEHADSNARLLPNRWMHVAMVYHSTHKSLLLYVNGILDRVMKPQGTLSVNDYPLYVGGDPFTQDKCGFTTYIDELRVYSHAVPPHMLQAEAAPALGGTDPTFVRLGCAQCSLVEAARSCPANRHVCTNIELHTGGYQVARSLGWLAAGTHVWTKAAVAKGGNGEAGSNSQEGLPASGLGLGLCCDGP